MGKWKAQTVSVTHTLLLTSNVYVYPIEDEVRAHQHSLGFKLIDSPVCTACIFFLLALNQRWTFYYPEFFIVIEKLLHSKRFELKAVLNMQ